MKHYFNRWTSACCGIVVACLLLCSAAQALIVLHINIEQMWGLASRVFRGSVLFVDKISDEEGNRLLSITFSVDEVFKGDLPSTVTIQQLDPEPIVMSDGTVARSLVARSVPQFHVGEKVLVFMDAPNPNGLMTTIGLHQGKFLVLPDQRVVNGIGNRGLFKGMPAQSTLQSLNVGADGLEALRTQPDRLTLDQMRTLLRGFAAEK